MLAKKYRLKKEKDFQEVLRKGKAINSEFLNLKFLSNGLKLSRIGFVVSAKISKKAVLRNQIKRRMREAVRAEFTKLKPGYDFIFFAKKGIGKKTFSELKNIIVKLFSKSGVWG